MRVLIQGKQLGPGDLGLVPRGERGEMVDPVSISYTIYKIDEDGTKTLASEPISRPGRKGIGVYFVPITVPTVWEGRYDLVWTLQQYRESAPQDVVEEFEVVRLDPATSSMEAPSVLVTSRPGLSKRTAEAIMMTRELLYDTDPDRNYQFRPPTPGKVVAGYTTRVGFIWTDATISRFLKLGMSMLNTWNPMSLTQYTIDNAPEGWRDAASLLAASKCLSAEGCRWAADEFSYSLNGVSLDLQKSGTYDGLANGYKSEFEEWAPLITANRPHSVGLRQQRWLLG
jgi:hypothetical protein